MMFTPVLLKKRTNRIGDTETETLQPSVFWFQPESETQFRSYTITIRYSIQLVAKEKKRQYTKTLLLIYYYYGKKEIKRQKCCGNFFHLKIKNQIKNKIKDPRDFWSHETFNLMRLLISQSKL